MSEKRFAEAFIGLTISLLVFEVLFAPRVFGLGVFIGMAYIVAGHFAHKKFVRRPTQIKENPDA